jgi:hypothetical protein
LRPDFLAAAVHLAAPFRVGAALPRLVAFVDDGAVQNVFPQGKMQVRRWVVDEFDWFDVWEGVERDVDEGGRDVCWYS